MKNLHDIIKLLSQRDTEALKAIYEHRCLTFNQIYETFYMQSLNFNKVVSDVSARKKIKDFQNYKLIWKSEYLGTEVYFLSPMGIEVVRHCFDLPTNIYDESKRVIKRGYYTAKDLEIFQKYIPHQINLNQFVLDFKKMNIDSNWKYYDEKYVSQYTNIRPDGMITINDTDFFLEMDMSTESKKQLFEKWENYRSFLNSREYSYKERKIVVLFIVEGSAKDIEKDSDQIQEKIENRIDMIKYTIYERLLDVIDSDFDIFIGSKEQLLNVLSDKLIPELKDEYEKRKEIQNTLMSHGFNIDSASALKESFNGTEFTSYIRKINPHDNRIFIENEKIQEFVIDDYYYCPASVLSKIAYLEKSNAFFRSKFNREISYLVIAESIEQIYNDMKIVDLVGVKNVYLSTLERLNKLPFHEALVQFDFLGNVHHFTNSGLINRVYIKNMKDLSLSI